MENSHPNQNQNIIKEAKITGKNSPVNNNFSINTQNNLKEGENELLNFLPKHAKNLPEFIKMIRNKIGILFLYNKNELDFVTHIVMNLLESKELEGIIEQKFVTYSLEERNAICKNVRIYI